MFEVAEGVKNIEFAGLGKLLYWFFFSLAKYLFETGLRSDKGKDSEFNIMTQLNQTLIEFHERYDVISIQAESQGITHHEILSQIQHTLSTNLRSDIGMDLIDALEAVQQFKDQRVDVLGFDLNIDEIKLFGGPGMSRYI